MNERIEELAKQAFKESGEQFWWSEAVFEKFAELIVKECASLYERSADNWFGSTTKDALRIYANKLKEHFGVEE